jgi:tetratricopeptide (TPR) repeat protein
MALLAPLAGCGCGLSTVADGGEARAGKIPRITWAGGVAGLAWCAMAALPVHVRAMQDSATWKTVEHLSPGKTDGATAAPASTPRDLAALSDLGIAQPRLHLELAKLHIQTFEARQQVAENPMSLSDLRQATVSAPFESAHERRDWLQRATGGNIDLLLRAQAHVRRCLETCPCEGRAYLYSSDLCFLDGGDAARQRELIAVARRFRPFTAQVDFAAGQLEWQSGDVAEALEHWKKAYDRSETWRKTIAALLITHMPAAEFLSTFRPDWQTLRELQHQMHESRHPEYAVVARQFAESSVTRAHEVTDGSEELLLRDALNVYRRLDDAVAVADCALLSVRYAPGSYDAHAAAGRALAGLGRDAEALEQLRWCLQRKPNDAPLSELFRSVLDRAGRSGAIALTDFAVEAGPDAALENDETTAHHGQSGVAHSEGNNDDQGQLDLLNLLNVKEGNP